MTKIMLNDIEYLVIITYKKIKRLYLRVKGTNIYINCNCSYSEKDILAFIYSKKNWILKNTFTSKKEINNSYIYYLGNKYKLEYIKSEIDSVEISNKNIYISSNRNEQEYLLKIFYKFCYKNFLNIIEKMGDICLEKLKEYNLTRPSIQVKFYKSKWGSCNYRYNRISINIALVHYPLEVIEAVVWHEYCHLVVANHSKSFYDLVYSKMDDYNLRYRKLR